MIVLITGANGSVGSALAERLIANGDTIVTTDIDSLDVTKQIQCQSWCLDTKPDLVYHLAGAKHAPEGEEDPEHVATVNINGTANIIRAARLVNAKVVVASTCKACDPETAYGASKLIAERITLNAGQVVARFYNVRETSGNVFRLWEQIPETEPIPYTDCWRYFISLEQVLDLLIACADAPPGRYTVDPGLSQYMRSVASETYPGRSLSQVNSRRGDRHAEPLHAMHEWLSPSDGLVKITGLHDLFATERVAV